MRHAFALAALLLVLQTGCTATTALRAYTEADRERAVYTPAPGTGSLELSGDRKEASLSRVASGGRDGNVVIAVGLRCDGESTSLETLRHSVPREVLSSRDEVVAVYYFLATRPSMAIVVRDREGRGAVVTRAASGWQRHQATLWEEHPRPLLEALLMLPAVACDVVELALRLPFGGG